MFEQMDIFAASITESDLQEKHDKEYKQELLTPRQWALWRLIEYNSLTLHRKTSQKEICDKLSEYGYVYNEDIKVHDHCSMVWEDIKSLNLSYQNDKVIITKDYEYWIGNEQETKDFLDKLWKDLAPRLVRYWAYNQKVSRNGQGQLFSTRLDSLEENSKARRFIESYNEFKIGDYYGETRFSED